LARRVRCDLRRLEASWLARCATKAEIREEDPGYAHALSRSFTPLVEALAARRLAHAELHALELFHDLRDLGVSTPSTLLVVDCLHAELVKTSGSSEQDAALRAGNDELRRLLTRVAVEVAIAPHGPRALAESGERPRAEGMECLVGSSERTRRLRSELADLADTPRSALIVGESGSGKELVAQGLHRLSLRRDRPFLAINCAALSRELIESELFGHERGAFTGSREAAPGLLRAAADGTVFLDEVTEMPHELQPKLLRALEQRAVRPVGGVKEVPFHARIVAATNRDPEQAVRAGQLRADLYYRLCTHRVDVPPLRERGSDLIELAEHFLRDIAARGQRVPPGFSKATMALLLEHDWPGNVRELRNAVEHCCATAKGELVVNEHLPRYLQQNVAAANSSGTFRRAEPHLPDLPAAPAKPLMSLLQVEREHISRALAATAGNKASAARLLGISRHQLYVRLERLGLGEG
jgi:DNA-binding NtrC family response regulator